MVLNRMFGLHVTIVPATFEMDIVSSQDGTCICRGPRIRWTPCSKHQ